MGCVESNEVLSSDVLENQASAPTPSQTTAPASEKVKKKRRHSIRERFTSGKKTSAEELNNRTESTKIYVIWRRVSVFSTRRDSMKSSRSESPGPSHLHTDQELQPNSSDSFARTH